MFDDLRSTMRASRRDRQETRRQRKSRALQRTGILVALPVLLATLSLGAIGYILGNLRPLIELDYKDFFLVFILICFGLCIVYSILWLSLITKGVEEDRGHFPTANNWHICPIFFRRMSILSFILGIIGVVSFMLVNIFCPSLV